MGRGSQHIKGFNKYESQHKLSFNAIKYVTVWVYIK